MRSSSRYKLSLVTMSPTPQADETSLIYVSGHAREQEASNRVIHRCSQRRGMDVMVLLRKKTVGGASRLTGRCSRCGYQVVVQG